MKNNVSPYLPVFEVTRGKTVESVHFGAIAVIDAHGELLASYGDIEAISYQRSSAKPFQALPLIENGGQQLYDLTLREIAIMCGSHSGTDDHIAVINSLQSKTGVSETELLCGEHYPFHTPTAESIREQGQRPTSNHHNCSGKHTGMLALARMLNSQDYPANLEISYLDPSHPVQKMILSTFAEMHGLSLAEVQTGIDGCSAPIFAVPLRNTALAFARLCDPEVGMVFPKKRAEACRTISKAMVAHPNMVAGPDRFDTCLMEQCRDRLVAKGGAEGYQGIGLFPGVLGPGFPGVGIAIKISDGGARKNLVSAVALEVLHQLRIIDENEIAALSELGPKLKVQNWRNLVVGEGYPVFQLIKTGKME